MQRTLNKLKSYSNQFSKTAGQCDVQKKIIFLNAKMKNQKLENLKTSFKTASET